VAGHGDGATGDGAAAAGHGDGATMAGTAPTISAPTIPPIIPDSRIRIALPSAAAAAALNRKPAAAGISPDGRRSIG
jgi:hypothetical protein